MPSSNRIIQNSHTNTSEIETKFERQFKDLMEYFYTKVPIKWWAKALPAPIQTDRHFGQRGEWVIETAVPLRRKCFDFV